MYEYDEHLKSCNTCTAAGKKLDLQCFHCVYLTTAMRPLAKLWQHFQGSGQDESLLIFFKHAEIFVVIFSSYCTLGLLPFIALSLYFFLHTVLLLKSY